MSEIKTYSIEEIKAAFIKYYHSGRTVLPEESLTVDQDDDLEFNDFIKHLNPQGLNMSDNEKIIEEFKKIVEDIYEQGYICGFSANREKWVGVYAKAMAEIANGEEFGDKLLFACDDSIPTNMSGVH